MLRSDIERQTSNSPQDESVRLADLKRQYDVVILGAGHPPSPSSLRTRLRLAKGFGVASNGGQGHNLIAK